MLFKNYIPLSSAILSAEAFKEVGGIDESLSFSEDYDIFLKLSKNYNVISINKALSIYRIHQNNMSQKNLSLGYMESIKILKKYIKYRKILIFSIIFNYLKYFLISIKYLFRK